MIKQLEKEFSNSKNQARPIFESVNKFMNGKPLNSVYGVNFDGPESRYRDNATNENKQKQFEHKQVSNQTGDRAQIKESKKRLRPRPRKSRKKEAVNTQI